MLLNHYAIEFLTIHHYYMYILNVEGMYIWVVSGGKDASAHLD